MNGYGYDQHKGRQNDEGQQRNDDVKKPFHEKIEPADFFDFDFLISFFHMRERHVKGGAYWPVTYYILLKS